jgi:hypothetical protein
MSRLFPGTSPAGIIPAMFRPQFLVALTTLALLAGCSQPGDESGPGGASGAGVGGQVSGSGGQSGGASGRGGSPGGGGGSTADGGSAGGAGPAGTGGGSAGAGGGNASSCAAVTTLDACDARSDCHAVFRDEGVCDCAPSGCCTQFLRCADGDRAVCAATVLCRVATPYCEPPYVVSYAGSCYEGCARASECMATP